ncbi:MAG TPA: hypothetical protein VKA95_17680 [Nitrososphaeraceae archaeon]|nr:hypothetical protein [Nitrososphaeraceae archaeon]
MSASAMNTRIILLAISMILGLCSFAASTQDSFSQTSTDTNTLRFSKPLNLTNNPRDSVSKFLQIIFTDPSRVNWFLILV